MTKICLTLYIIDWSFHLCISAALQATLKLGIQNVCRLGDHVLHICLANSPIYQPIIDKVEVLCNCFPQDLHLCSCRSIRPQFPTLANT